MRREHIKYIEIESVLDTSCSNRIVLLVFDISANTSITTI